MPYLTTDFSSVNLSFLKAAKPRCHCHSVLYQGVPQIHSRHKIALCSMLWSFYVTPAMDLAKDCLASQSECLDPSCQVTSTGAHSLLPRHGFSMANSAIGCRARTKHWSITGHQKERRGGSPTGALLDETKSTESCILLLTVANGILGRGTANGSRTPCGGQKEALEMHHNRKWSPLYFDFLRGFLLARAFDRVKILPSGLFHRILH